MILEVSGLNIVTADTGSPIVRDLSCSLGQGQTLGIVGESGSGKTSTALAMLGMVRPGLAVASGRIEVAGEPMLGRRERDLRLIRGRVIAYLGQDPASSLTPTMRVGRQVAETLALGPGAAPDRVSRWLESFELPGHREFQRRYPHQISGGEQQRVALARALASHPRVLVLDEPTTGLDVVTQDLVLTEIERQRSHLSLTVVIVSHDLAVVARLADRVLVMSGGEVVEQGNLVDVLSTLQHEHTRSLAEAAPDHRAVPARQQQQEPKASLRVEHLTVSHRSVGARVVAADDVSFRVEAGHCLALVGSSGSGKTTIARSVVGLHRPDGGGVYLHDVLLAGDVKDRSRQQRRRIQLVHQDPYGSLNPRHRVGKAIARPLQLLHGMTTTEARAEVRQLLERVRLPASFGDRLPARLSGGERQRVAIAMALAAGPEVLVCDEITSALDTSVQATILDLIDELRRDLGLGVLLISHDLGVVARLADRVLVLLDHGRVCEQGPVEQVLTSPDHDLTKKLLASSPSLSATLRGLG